MSVDLSRLKTPLPKQHPEVIEVRQRVADAWHRQQQAESRLAELRARRASQRDTSDAARRVRLISAGSAFVSDADIDAAVLQASDASFGHNAALSALRDTQARVCREIREEARPVVAELQRAAFAAAERFVAVQGEIDQFWQALQEKGYDGGRFDVSSGFGPDELNEYRRRLQANGARPWGEPPPPPDPTPEFVAVLRSILDGSLRREWLTSGDKYNLTAKPLEVLHRIDREDPARRIDARKAIEYIGKFSLIEFTAPVPSFATPVEFTPAPPPEAEAEAVTPAGSFGGKFKKPRRDH
jgi:DNA-binding protein YbaB